MRILFPMFLLFSTLITTSCGPKAMTSEEYYSTPIKLPDGTVILAESMRTPQEMMRGMMFRDELKPDRGMLFSHGSPGRYPYWMYQVKIPLDIIWVGADRKIVEISANTPPCPAGLAASKCPRFGGSEDSLFVVELAGGVAAKHGLKVGDMLVF
ncbi:MAG TPA: DUF192 domain-containing protein [Bryobacteraceae bacterium]|jgi:hypothetical protein